MKSDLNQQSLAEDFHLILNVVSNEHLFVYMFLNAAQVTEENCGTNPGVFNETFLTFRWKQKQVF